MIPYQVILLVVFYCLVGLGFIATDLREEDRYNADTFTLWFSGTLWPVFLVVCGTYKLVTGKNVNLME